MIAQPFRLRSAATGAMRAVCSSSADATPSFLLLLSCVLLGVLRHEFQPCLQTGQQYVELGDSRSPMCTSKEPKRIARFYAAPDRLNPLPSRRQVGHTRYNGY
jgi:hypothetical protein